MRAVRICAFLQIYICRVLIVTLKLLVLVFKIKRKYCVSFASTRTQRQGVCNRESYCPMAVNRHLCSLVLVLQSLVSIKPLGPLMTHKAVFFSSTLCPAHLSQYMEITCFSYEQGNFEGRINGRLDALVVVHLVSSHKLVAIVDGARLHKI